MTTVRGAGRGWACGAAETPPRQPSELDSQIERLMRCEILKEAEVKALCDKAREILIDEANVQRVDAPVTVRRAGGRSVRGFFGV